MPVSRDSGQLKSYSRDGTSRDERSSRDASSFFSLLLFHLTIMLETASDKLFAECFHDSDQKAAVTSNNASSNNKGGKGQLIGWVISIKPDTQTRK